ncbi:MAG: hypothetical protein ACO1TE_08575 [Prosthecobacter sp.]
MKTSTPFVIAAFCASCAWPVTAQVANPPSRQVTPTGNNSNVVPDGVTFYHGQTYLLRNGRAALVDGTLVPEGKVLTRAGRLVPMPPELSGRPESRTQIAPAASSDAVQDGIVHTRGRSFMVRGTSLVPIDSKLIPEGAVLNAANILAPLPSDFSGFNLERTPIGTSTLPVRTDSGIQALAGQAGVPQVGASVPQAPRITVPQPSVAPAGASGVTRTGMVTNPDGTTTPIGITPNGAAISLDGRGTVMTGAAVNAAGAASAGVNAGNNTTANGGSPNANGQVSASAPNTPNLGAGTGGRTFQPAVNANGTVGASGVGINGQVQGAVGTNGQVGTTSNLQPGVNTNGTTGIQSTPSATPNGAVNAQGTPTATQTGAVGAQGTPAATQTGNAAPQGSSASAQQGGQTATPIGGATRTATGALTSAGVRANSVGNSPTSTATTAQGAPPIGSGANGAAGTTGTAAGGAAANGTGGNAQSTGTSGGPSAAGGASGGGGTSGGPSAGGGASGGGGTSGGSSGGGTSGGSGGGTSGGGGGGGGGGAGGGGGGS